MKAYKTKSDDTILDAKKILWTTLLLKVVEAQKKRGKRKLLPERHQAENQAHISTTDSIYDTLHGNSKTLARKWRKVWKVVLSVWYPDHRNKTTQTSSLALQSLSVTVNARMAMVGLPRKTSQVTSDGSGVAGHGTWRNDGPVFDLDYSEGSSGLDEWDAGVAWHLRVLPDLPISWYHEGARGAPSSHWHFGGTSFQAGNVAAIASHDKQRHIYTIVMEDVQKPSKKWLTKWKTNRKGWQTLLSLALRRKILLHHLKTTSQRSHLSRPHPGQSLNRPQVQRPRSSYHQSLNFFCWKALGKNEKWRHFDAHAQWWGN